jgi:RNA polymerase sigma-70 factor (ECF subfamily)
MDRGACQRALEDARQGDLQALDQLLQSFRPYVEIVWRALHYDRAGVGGHGADRIPEVFHEAQRGFAAFEGTTLGELAMWLRRITVRWAGHTLPNLAGAAPGRPTSRSAVGDSGLGPDQHSSEPGVEPARHEQAARLAGALACLPAELRQVLLDRHVADWPHRVIAEQLGQTETVVRLRYVQALRRLREVSAG